MEVTTERLDVYFDDPFWVAVCQRWEKGKLYVARQVLGAEPSDGELYAFLLRHGGAWRFSPGVPEQQGPGEIKNPKRRQRAIRKETQRQQSSGTKAQQALAKQREEQKKERRQDRRQQKEAEKQRQYLLHKQKQKEKHRGR